MNTFLYSCLAHRSAGIFAPARKAIFFLTLSFLFPFFHFPCVLHAAEFRADNGGGALEQAKSLFSQEFSEAKGVILKGQLAEKRFEALKQDFGLNLTGYYSNRVIKDASADTGDSFDSNAYIGLEWDFFKNGFFEARQDKDDLEKDIAINSALMPYLKGREQFQLRYYNIIYSFNVSKIERLKQRVSFLDEYAGIAERLYFSRDLAWEDLLVIREKRVVAGLMLKNFVDFNASLKVFENEPRVSSESLPVFNVDIVKLAGLAAEKDPFRRAASIEDEKALKAGTVLDELTLRAFLRYHANDPLSDTQTDNVSAGLYFKMPLPPGSRQGREANGLKYGLEATGLRRQAEDRLMEIHDEFYEYNFKLKDYYTFLYRAALIEERLRREYIKKAFADPASSGLAIMRLKEELSAVEVEAIDVKQRMYLKLLSLSTLAGADEFFSSASVVNPRPEPRYKATRSLYVWSKAFNRLENDFLGFFMKNQEFEEIMLSFGADADRVKLGGLIQLLSSSGIKTLATLGDNDLIFEKNREKIARLAGEAAAYGAYGIHLDVEPHTLPDWREKRQEYLRLYIEMLQNARMISDEKGMLLTVSIPANLDAEVLKNIYRLADKIYIMAYGDRSVSAILRRTAEEVEAGREKTVIAVRPSDFSARTEFEAFINGIVEQGGIERIAVHEMDALLGLEQTGLDAE